jgi:hypothetical protein
MPRRPNYGFQKQQKDLKKQKKREEKNEKKRLKSEAAATENAAPAPTETEGED